MMQQHELRRITKLLFLLCKQFLKLYTDTEYEYLCNNWEREAYKSTRKLVAVIFDAMYNLSTLKNEVSERKY